MRAAFAGVLIGLVVGGAALAPSSRAQPAPDLVKAKELYLAAEAAVAEGRFADAIRDYGATFDITRDPILFYKIGAANEKAGRCDVALIYYGRYFKEGRPNDRYVELTKERVLACGGDPRTMTAGRTPDPVPPKVEPPAEGSGSAAGSAAEPAVEPAREPAAPVTAPAPSIGRHRGAWLLVATSIGFVTIGSVLAYSADSAENDIDDLYQGFTGTPAEFDDKTRATYDDLIDEGRRYEKLSWLSFGLAGATAIGAIVLWKTSDEKSVTVAPTATPDSAGVRATLRW